MRRRLVAVALLAGATIGLPSAPVGAAPRPSSGVGSFGIQLLGARTGTGRDPLARSYIVSRLAPGASVRRRVKISNNTRSTARIAVYPAGARLRGGRFGFTAGHTPNELSRWTSVSRDALRLPPGDSAISTVTVKVPKRVSPGERYAVVWAEMSTHGRAAGGVTLVNRVGIRIYLSVERGGEANFAIGPLRAGRSVSGRPFVIATVRNSGGRALTISGSLTLSNGPGGLRPAPFPVEVRAGLAPGNSKQATVPLDRRLPSGPWRARLRLSSGSIQRTAQATLTFPRVAPAPVGARARGAAASNLPIFLMIGLLGVLVVAASTILLRRGGSGIRRQ